MQNDDLLHRYAVLVASSTLALIFVGGLVTSTGSGLSVPDWPLSFGRFFPPMVGGVLYEHGHRMVATLVGILTVGLALLFRKWESRRWVRRLAGAALLAVVLQGLLGGATVLLRLPPAVSVGHAALAQIFFCITVTLALVTSKGWRNARPRAQDSKLSATRTLALLTTGVISVQILIGAWMRHTGAGLAIPDFPLSFGQLVPPFLTGKIVLNFAHRIGALLVLFAIGWLSRRVLREFEGESYLVTPAIILVCAAGAQVMLGAFTVWSIRMVVPTTLHVAGGAFTLASSLALTLRLYQNRVSQDAALERVIES
jgi:heme a synthase